MSNKRVNKMLKIGSCLGLIAAIFSAAALPGMNVAVHAEENKVEPVKQELPEVGNAPLEGYTIGEWSSNIEYELTHKDDEAHFTYTYSVISDTDVKPSKPSDTENPKNESTVKETKTENKVVNTAYSTNVLSVLGLFMLSLAGMLFGVVKKYLK